MIKWPPLVFPVTLAADASGLCSSQNASEEITALLDRKKQLYAKLNANAVAEAAQAVQAMPVPSPAQRPLQLCANPPKKSARMCLKAKNPPPKRGSVQAAAQTDSGAGLGLKIVFSTVCILYSSSL